MQTISKRTIVLSAFALAMLGLVLALFTAGRSYAAAPDTRIYDSIPSPLPPNYPSLGLHATSTKEFGDHIKFARASNKLSSVGIGMSSWACETGGSWSLGNCTTTPGATFDHPITLNLYAVDNSVPGNPAPGTLLFTKTVTFTMPYRPSVDPTCGGSPPTQWKDANGDCYNGLAFEIEFDLSGDSVTVPQEIIYGIHYAVSRFDPVAVGGPWDSLNVGVSDVGAQVGTNPDPNDTFLRSTWAGAYCTGNQTPTDVFRRDYPCWTDYVPTARFNTVAADVEMTITKDLVCGSAQTVSIDFKNVTGLYGYEFKVDYDATKVSAAGAWENGWYNTSGAIKPWDATCAAGQCKFSVAMLNGTPVNGSGKVATIALSPVAAGSFTLKIKDVVLSDIDGMPIPVDVANNGEIAIDVCGYATVNGTVSLQGRLTPMNPGWVVFKDTGGNFADMPVPFNAAGNYTASVPVMPLGSNYSMRAFHHLYLGNERAAALWTPSTTYTIPGTRLLGGDANNSGIPSPFTPGVNTFDLTCIGTDFGGGSNLCGTDPDSGTDINNDSTVNVQDLSIAGGNYNKNPFLGW